MKKIEELANEILKNSLEENESIFIKEVEDGIYYACVNTKRRGPGSVIIGKDLSFLFGSSAIGYSKLLENFKNGERTKVN